MYHKTYRIFTEFTDIYIYYNNDLYCNINIYIQNNLQNNKITVLKFLSF